MSEASSLPPEGQARFGTPRDSVTAGTYDTVTIEYTVGSFGMDDGSSFGVVYNQTTDASHPQTADPTDDGYLTVSTTGEATVEAGYERFLWKRPFSHGVRVSVTDGSIDPGETITLTFGDRSAGSLGHRHQSFVETDYEYRVLADPVRTGEFVETTRLTYDVVSAPAVQCEAVLPSTAEVGDAADLQVRMMDRWGNVDRGFRGELTVESVDGPTVDVDPVAISDGTGSTTFTIPEDGRYRLQVGDSADMQTTTNPLVVGSDLPTTYWGDIHGQSGETVGTGTIHEYFTYARDCGFVDFASHAGNDFQITDAFWDTIRETIRSFHEPGEFVTFPCYEWSANTPAGGDHNVYFKDDDAAAGEPIQHSHSWLITDDDAERSAGTWPIQALYDAYDGRDDVLIIPHQGGRPAARDAYDPDLTPFLEITSVWGVFEWFGREAIEDGWEIGLVGGSDDHTGRPGTAAPDNLPKHNLRGGLLGAQTATLDREHLWDAFNERRVYGTTGARTLLETEVNGNQMGASVDATAGESVAVTATVHGTAPIRDVSLFRDGKRIATDDLTESGDELVELTWTGAKGTGRDKLIDWDGGATLDGGRITEVEEFGFSHADDGVSSTDPTTVTWDAATSGNYQGVRLQVDDTTPETELRIATTNVQHDLPLAALAEGPVTVELPEFLDASLSIRRTGPATETDATVSFEDTLPDDGAAYHVRVTQADGHMAWSSPTHLQT